MMKGPAMMKDHRPMRMRSLVLAVVLFLPIAAGAASAPTTTPAPPPPELQTLQEALASDDADAKRSALRALASKSVGEDDLVLPVMVQAVGDRQARDAAIQALRARTGLQPSPYVGQSHYPNYPSGDKPSDWQQWLSERHKEVEEKAKLKEAVKLAEEAKKTAKEAKKEAADGKDADPEKVKPEATAKAVEPSPRKPLPEDLGQLHRVVFKNGSSLICYILARRADVDGTLLSLRVVHPDGAGEETLDAGMISRVEDDVH